MGTCQALVTCQGEAQAAGGLGRLREAAVEAGGRAGPSQGDMPALGVHGSGQHVGALLGHFKYKVLVVFEALA